MSVASSIYDHVVENGRTYHRYKEGKYMLPNDEVGLTPHCHPLPRALLILHKTEQDRLGIFDLLYDVVPCPSLTGDYRLSTSDIHTV